MTLHCQLFFDVAVFLLSNLVTGPNFMSLSLLVPELWQFSCIRDWIEIQKLEIHCSEFCTISGYQIWANVSNELLLNAAKCQGYSFWKTSSGGEGGEVKLPPAPPD